MTKNFTFVRIDENAVGKEQITVTNSLVFLSPPPPHNVINIFVSPARSLKFAMMS